MAGVESLLEKIEKQFENMPKDVMASKLCGVAEVMSNGSVRLSQEQVAQYDILLCRFASEIEEIALSKLAFILAHEENGPPKMVEFLARHEDILVAGPVLAGSPMLDDILLTQIVQSRPQPHLHAVCERATLSEIVTSALLIHGDESTMRRIAKNPGASFTEQGYATLIERSKADDELAVCVGERSDIPAHHLKILLDSAADHVRDKLIKSRPAIASVIKSAVTSAARDVEETAPATSARLTEAHEKIAALYRSGRLDSAALVKLAKQRLTDETLIAMALMCRVDPGAAYRAIDAFGHDITLMMARICELTWPDAKKVLQALKGPMSQADAEKARTVFARLNPQMARKVLQMRLRPGAKASVQQTTQH